jgi:hypothetical protein
MVYDLEVRQMRRLIAVLAFALVATAGRPANATPIFGAQLFYTGGDVTNESLPVTSGFTSELGLYDSSFNRLLFIMNDEPAGVTVTFNPAVDFSIPVGAELIFGIRVVDTGDEFFMGPGTRNPDNVIHAVVDDQGGGVFNVGFEDIFGGGDLDFDDNAFQFEGGLEAVPEPATLSLLAIGVIPGALRKRRSR